MRKTFFYTKNIFLILLTACTASEKKQTVASSVEVPFASQVISNARQLTFEGKRAGEGYFSADGKLIIFQSEREASNPFYQMYVKNLETGETKRVSNGVGKTTCGWVHPSGKKVLFSSTHQDPKAHSKMQEEFEIRKKGTQRSYSWDFDETYDIYETDLKTGGYKNLSNAKGYDAEASWSPDGQWIVFASDRHAFSENLSDADKIAIAKNPSSMVELYIMKADGTEVKRLTNDIGYDGGPFFSSNGKKIVWRKFSADGRAAEIYSMNVDGSGITQLTNLSTLSWAPYFHPSGDYIVFGSALLGHHNFELFVVRADGQGKPVRVTNFEKFDSLPVFLPDGIHVSWTSQRSWDNTSQIFIADWDDKLIRNLLGLPAREHVSAKSEKTYNYEKIKKDVEYLSSVELGGRLTGSPGEIKATTYVAEQFRAMGLKPAGDKGGYYGKFEFPSGLELGPNNKLAGTVDYALDKDWRPLTFSSSGKFEINKIVFAGYGIVAPGSDEVKAYDSYAGLDVKDKWVVVFRYMPEKLSEKTKLYLSTFSDLPTKARRAKEKGAAGIVVVNGPNSGASNQLISLGKLGSDLGILAFNVSDELLQGWLQSSSLKTIQDQYDEGKDVKPIELNTKLSGNIDLVHKKGEGQNAMARLVVGNAPSYSFILVGAHIDHLGLGETNTSRADKDQQGRAHLGADDNASGVAGVLEIARILTEDKSLRSTLKKDIVFAVWSGEELGLLGSSNYAMSFKTESLQTKIDAYFNLDMVGRLQEKLFLQGVGSSKNWPGLIESSVAALDFPIYLQADPYLPTDVLKFYMLKVPVINAFTGSHRDYHTPNDTPDKINYNGIAKTAVVFSKLVAKVSGLNRKPDYEKVQGGSGITSRAGFRITLGTMPDYTQASTIKGVLLSGVISGSPADKAGLKANDVVVELAGRKITNIYEYSDLLRVLKPGEEIEVKIKRGESQLSLKLTPEAHK